MTSLSFEPGDAAQVADLFSAAHLLEVDGVWGATEQKVHLSPTTCAQYRPPRHPPR